MSFIYPTIDGIHKGDPSAQLQVVIGELTELWKALDGGSVPEILDEFCDVEQAFGNMRRQLTHLHGVSRLRIARQDCIGKCRKRGYYTTGSAGHASVLARAGVR